MRNLILAPKECRRIGNGYSVETYPITIHKEAQFFFNNSIEAPCFWKFSNGKIKELSEIRTFEDFEKYRIDYEVCGNLVVVISKHKHCYIFAKNGDFTTLSTDTTSTFTSGKVRIFTTQKQELVFRVEEYNRTYMINPDKAL